MAEEQDYISSSTPRSCHHSDLLPRAVTSEGGV